MYNNDNKKEWEDAQMQIVNFSFNDVIATSDGEGEGLDATMDFGK